MLQSQTLKWNIKKKRLKWNDSKKGVKPSTSYPQIFYTIARKENKNSLEKRRKEYIFIYPSYVYLYINNSYNEVQASREGLSRHFKILPSIAIRLSDSGRGAAAVKPQSPVSLRCRALFDFPSFTWVEQNLTSNLLPSLPLKISCMWRNECCGLRGAAEGCIGVQAEEQSRWCLSALVLPRLVSGGGSKVA